MDPLPRACAGRLRARATGAASIAILVVLAAMVLVAGLWIGTDGPAARAPGAAPRVERPATESGHDDAAASVPAADDDGPALARAAEAGLNRMRVQFSQSLLPSLPGADDVDALATSAAAALGLGGAPAATPSAATPAAARPGDAPVEVRDLRDPRAQRDAGKPALREPPPQRRLTLPPPERMMRLPPAEGSVTWVGESTVLIRSHGLTVLTDPGFLRRGERARLGWGLSAVRRADPAIDLDELPPIDVVVISRLREDRFDRVARRRLPRDVPIVAPAEARAELVSMGFSTVHALPAWGSLQVVRGDARLVLTATPTRAGPPLLSALLPGSMGTLLEFGRDDGDDRFGYRIWVSGDTAVDEALLAELEPRLAGVDLALLHVGGAPLGLGGSMDGAGGIEAARRLGARTAIALRLGDYGGTPVPARTLALAAQRTVGEAAARRVRVLERGDVHRFAPVQHWARADEASTAR